MSFLGTEPTPAGGAEATVDNDGWFPAVDLTELRACVRLDGTVTPERLRVAAVNAIATVNGELVAFKDAQQLAGHGSLADVTSPAVDGKPAHVHRYLRAVYASVQVDLIERYRDFDTTGAGDKSAEKLELSVDALRRDARWAISDILGRRRTTVELI